MSHHAERVFESVSSSAVAGRSKVAASWWRSYQVHGISPAQRSPADGPDMSRLKAQSEASGRLLHLAEPRLTELYGLVASFGGGVFLTDPDAFVLASRTHDAQTDAFRIWGLEAGQDWSEAVQGTNGIGTFIAEARALTIHRDEHFEADNIGMSCIDAPIFGPDGALAGALNVSLTRTDQTENLNQLILAIVTRRYLIHVLHPSRQIWLCQIACRATDGFHRIRHYGLLASAQRKGNIPKLRALLGTQRVTQEDTPSAEIVPLTLREPCPECGSPMRIIETVRRGQVPRSRAPPQRQAA